MIGLHRVGPQLDGEFRLDPQEVAPPHRPVVGKFLALQEAIDQLAALTGIRIAQELPGFVGRGQDADEIQVDPAEKDSVGADARRGDSQLLEPAKNQLIEAALGHQLAVAFKRTRR